MIKSLVIYYSLEGNTRLLAETIASEIGADLLELKPKKDINPAGFMKYFWAGKAVIQKQKPPLLPFACDPLTYELIFIGTPVWAGNFVPALNSFFSQIKLNRKKAALFCCHEGGKNKTLENMKKNLAGNDILGENDFITPLKKDRESAVGRAREWARQILKSAGG